MDLFYVSAEPPRSLACPLTARLFHDPVVAADGYSYERNAIEAHLCESALSPTTGRLLTSRRLHPNLALRERCAQWVEQHSTEAGFRARLCTAAGVLCTTTEPREAVKQLEVIRSLVTAAGNMRCLLIAPVGLRRLQRKMDADVASASEVVAAAAKLERKLLALVGAFQNRLRTLRRLHRASVLAIGAANRGEGSTLAARLADGDTLALALKRALALAERQRDQAQKALRDAQMAVRKAKRRVLNLKGERRVTQSQLSDFEGRVAQFEELGTAFHGEGVAVRKRLEAVGAVAAAAAPVAAASRAEGDLEGDFEAAIRDIFVGHPAPGKHGWSVEAIMDRLPGSQEASVRAILAQLCGDGELQMTVDSDHFLMSATFSSWTPPTSPASASSRAAGGVPKPKSGSTASSAISSSSSFSSSASSSDTDSDSNFDPTTATAHARSLFEEGFNFYWGLNFQKKDTVRGQTMIEAAAVLGSPMGIAKCKIHGWGGYVVNRKEAAATFSRLASAGYVPSINLIGWCYHFGVGVKRADVEKAVACYTRASQCGSTVAMNNLANCYLQGLGVKKNLAKAFEYFSESAEGGDSDSMNSLGLARYYGLGCTRDLALTIEWYTRAAKQGNDTSMFNLALCYLKGEGVAPDEGTAMAWLRRAKEAGNVHAQASMDVIETRKSRNRRLSL